MWGGGEGGGATKTLYPSKHLPSPLLATVSRKCGGGAMVDNAFHSFNACWYIRALNNNGNEHRR